VLLRALLVSLVIAAAEVLQGALRVRYLNRHVGDRRARQIGVFTGSMLILAIAWFTLPWIDARSPAARFGVGVVWFAVMLALDLYFGRVVFRSSWERIADEFDLRRGGLLGLGMLVLLLAPLIVAASQEQR
jgi:hypothetical protein